MLRLIAFAALGSFLGGLVVAIVGPPGAGIAIAGVSFTVLIFATVMTRVAGSLGGRVAASPKVVQQARDARRLGLARVDALRQTSTQINDQPLCDIDVTVQPLTGTAFATSLRTVVPLTAIPRFQPGAELEVAILLDGGPEVAFVDGELSPRDHERLTVPPRRTVPLLTVEPHTRIVDGRRKGPLLGVGKKGRPLRLALFAVVAVAAAAVVVTPYRVAVAQTVDAIQDGHLRPDMRHPDLLAQAQEALIEEIGHDQVMSVVITKDLVRVDAPLRPGDTATDRWTYSTGRVSHDGPATIQPTTAEEQLAWSDLALDRLWGLMQSSAEEVRLPVGDASASARRTPDGDINSETFSQPVGPPAISFSIGDAYGSTSFRYATDGTALED